jgi:hypothetical protein
MCLLTRIIKIEVVDRWLHWMPRDFCARDYKLIIAIPFIIAI